ncbi:MAG: InlB B-repeat-containing protein [Oscillospiraceae bacterium]|nr:InlB B-repeat-containing protein [Oscillospiraceae bacterium]
MFKRTLSLFLAILMAAGMFPFTSLTAYAAKKKDVNYFFPTLDTEIEYKYIERLDIGFSGDAFEKGDQVDAYMLGEKSTYYFNYLGSYYEYKKTEEYMPSVAAVARNIAPEYVDIKMNEIIIYRVDRGDGLDPLYGAVVAYDPQKGITFYGVSSPDGSPSLYNITMEPGVYYIDVVYCTDHGLGTKEIYHTVNYRDDDGTILCVREVRTGENAIPPSAPVKNGVTGQWNHTGEYINGDLDIYADYTGGEIFKPERPDDAYAEGTAPFVRDDYNQKILSIPAEKNMTPSDVENMVAGHTFEDIKVDYGLYQKQTAQIKEVGTYGELKNTEESSLGVGFEKLCEYLSETYSFNINEIIVYQTTFVSGQDRDKYCVIMGYDYDNQAAYVAYGLYAYEIVIYNPDDLRDKELDITFDIDIMSGYATRETHNVKYVREDGSVIKSVMVTNGKNVRTNDIPEVPEKDGYESKWSNDGTGINGDITIYPVYTRIGGEVEDTGPYTVNFYMPAWIVNLEREEPVTDENGNPYADEDPVLIHTEIVKHGEDVQYIPTIPWKASKAYEWHDWNDSCKNITENKDVIVKKTAGGKRVFSYFYGVEDTVCGAPYDGVANITPLDTPDFSFNIEDTAIGEWVLKKMANLATYYHVQTANVLGTENHYHYVRTYEPEGVKYLQKDISYILTGLSDVHSPDNTEMYSAMMRYVGLFGDQTAETLYGSDADASTRYANLKSVVEGAAAAYGIAVEDVPIHKLRDTEYAVWIAYTYYGEAIVICEHDCHYILDADDESSWELAKAKTYNGTLADISKKALEYEGKEATAVEKCEIIYTVNGKVVSTDTAVAGSKYKLIQPAAIRGYKTEGWKYNGQIVGEEITVEGSSMRFDASYSEESGASTGLASMTFNYGYSSTAPSGFTTKAGRSDVGKIKRPVIDGITQNDAKGNWTLKYFGVYDDIDTSKEPYPMSKFWNELLDADTEYTPTAKTIPIYELYYNGKLVTYGFIKAYDLGKGILLFDGVEDKNFVLSAFACDLDKTTFIDINYDGSATPYLPMDTTADNVYFANAYSIDKLSRINSIAVSGSKEPVDQYGTSMNHSGQWNFEKLGKYSEIKKEVYSYYLDSTVKNAAALLGVSADDVIVYDFRNGNTHIAYGAILAQSGGDSGDTKLFFIGDTAKDGSCFYVSHGSVTDKTYSISKSGNTDYSGAIKKEIGEYFAVSFYADGAKVSEMLVMSGSVITALPEVPEKAGYTGAWDYNNTPITADTKINAVYTLTEVEPDEPDEPVDNKAVFTPVEETPVNEAVIAIRSGDVFLSYESETGVVIETDEEGNVLAPAKNILWKVTDNGDGTVVFTNTVAGKQLAVFVDAEGNTRIRTVAGEEEINPGDDDIPGETTEQIEFLSETGDEGSTEPEVPTDPEESTGQVYTDWTITKLGSSFYLGITLGDGNEYFLTVSEDNKWVISAETAPVSFWETDEEPEQPEDPDEPVVPGEPGIGGRPYTTEELDAIRPEGPKKYDYAPTSVFARSGDKLIVYSHSKLADKKKYYAWNGETGKETALSSYDSNTGNVKEENVPEECIWIVEKCNDGCGYSGCTTEAYTLKNAATGQYIVHKTNGNLGFVSDPANNTSVSRYGWHFEGGYFTSSVDGVKRKQIGWYTHNSSGKVRAIDIESSKMVSSTTINTNFYINKPVEAGEIEYFAVQFVADGRLVDVKFVLDGEEVVEFPKAPEKEGYFGVWENLGAAITEDTIIEATYLEVIPGETLSKEQLDELRPEVEGTRYYNPSDCVEDGDRIIIYDSYYFDEKEYRSWNGDGDTTTLSGYNSETGGLKEGNVPESCIWILERCDDGCGYENCTTPAYTLKNASTGEYLVYKGDEKLYREPNPVKGENSVVSYAWHFKFGSEITSSDDIKRTKMGVYTENAEGEDIYIFRDLFSLVLGWNVKDDYYINRLERYYSVQFVADGKLLDVQFVRYGESITNIPELSLEEGYSYCWNTDLSNITKDVVVEPVITKDIVEVYGVDLGHSVNSIYFNNTHKGNTFDSKFSSPKTETFYNGYNTFTEDAASRQKYTIGEIGYLRDYTNAKHDAAIANQYNRFYNYINDAYGEGAYDNLKLHSISKNGKIIGIGIIIDVVDAFGDSEDKTTPAKLRTYSFNITDSDGNQTTRSFSDREVSESRAYVGHIMWDPSCSYDELFVPADFENETYTVTFKDLEGNTVYQENVVYYNDLRHVPPVPEREGYEGQWFAIGDVYTNIYEDKVIYPIYYKVVSAHGVIAGIDSERRSFFDQDYSTASREDKFSGYRHNGIMSCVTDKGVFETKEHKNTISLGYVGLISDLAIYTEDDNGFANIKYYSKEKYRESFNNIHYVYDEYPEEEKNAELPVFVLIDEETGELLEVVVGYAAYSLTNDNDPTEYPVIEFFDPQLNNIYVYTTRPVDSPFYFYEGGYCTLKPLWHFKDGVENLNIGMFSGLKNIEAKYVDENGETIHSEMLALGENVQNVPAVPAKAGYIGVWDHDGKNITQNTTIRPVYTQITHKVTINIDENKSYELEVADGEDVGLPATPPQKAGYKGSWDHDGKNITQDTVINAIYEKQEFTVTFMVEGKIVETRTVTTGGNVTLPSIPEKAGKNGEWNHDGKNITEDTIITAMYTPKTYEVEFIAGKDTVSFQEIEHGQNAAVPAVPAKEGYNGEWNGDPNNVTSDRIIRAVYTAKKYTVRYYDEDGDLVSKQSVAYGKNADEPDVPESKNYPGAGGRWNHDGKNITENTTIEPVYTYETHRVRYYVDGKLYHTQYVNNEQDAIHPAVPEKEGHTGSWDHDGKNIKKDTRINAVYEPANCYVYFYVDDEEIAYRRVKYGESVTNVPSIPEKEGYSGRWDKSLNKITAKETDVYAVYTEREYRVIFYLNGRYCNTQTVKYGENVVFPNVAQIEGCTVVWDNDGNNVKGDLNIYGTYKLNGYTVDRASGKTNEVIPADVYYGLSYGNAIGTGKNERLDVTGFNEANEAYNLVFWRDETGEAGSFTLSVPEQVAAPVVEMDYVTGTTKDIVGTDIYYGTNENMMITTGTNEKLTLVPGTTYYFYRPAEGDKLRSDTTVVNVGIVPEAVQVTIDYVGGTTNEVIGTEVEYAISDTELTIEEAKALEFTGRGSGEKYSPEKREEGYYMYFRVAATDANFASEITKVYVGPKGAVPNMAIDYYSEKTYRMLGSDIVYGYSEDEMIYVGNYDYLVITPGQDVYAYRMGSDSNQTFASDVVHVVVPERPVIENLVVENETIKGKGDGKVSGLIEGVKYRWHPANATWDYYNQVLTEDHIYVGAGEWQIRIQAVDFASFASEYYTFTIEEGRTLTLTVLDGEDGETLGVVDGLSYREEIALPNEPTKEGYVFDGWYWNDNGTERMFSFISGISDDCTVYAKWKETTDEVSVNELYGDKWIIDFGTITEGSGIIPTAIDVTITNKGAGDINILVLEPEYYSVSGPETIAAGASAVYAIEPLDTVFEAGNYNEEILIYNADNFDSYYFINALYSIAADENFNVTVKEDGEEVDEDGIIVDVGGDIELEADINAIVNAAPVLYSRFRSAPAAKAVPDGYSVRWEDSTGKVLSTTLKCNFTGDMFPTEGYYHFFLIVTGPKGYSVNIPITIYAGNPEDDHRITISPKSYRFGNDRREAQTFVISNHKGTAAVELTKVGSLKQLNGDANATNFIFGGKLVEEIAANGSYMLAPGETVEFTVQPKEGLAPGLHAEMVGAGVGNGTNYALAAVTYTEPEKLDIDTENELTVFTGSNIKLSAKATGGSEKYTYEWVNTETGKVVSRKSSALFGSSYTKETGTLNLEVTVTDSYGNSVTEKVKVNIVDRNYDIAVEPGKLDFGTDYNWFRNAKEKTVTLKNIGNSNVTLKEIESEYFDISDIGGIVLKPGESIEITVAPKDGLAIGEYREDISIITEQGTKAELAAVYKIIRIFGNGSENKPSVPEKSEDEFNPSTGAEVILP